MADWFEEWFGEEYLQLYAHRDEDDAARLVALLQRTIPWQAGSRVLDVGCGPGRHAQALNAVGARVIGIDLSMVLLQKARGQVAVPLVRADMRMLPVRSETMDLTVNLFTSFGYFDDDADHEATIGEMARTVRRGGWFVLDFLNADRVRRGLVLRERMSVGSQSVEVTRSISDDDRFVVKTFILSNGRQARERVRLFQPDQLERMMTRHQLTIAHRFGDYDGSALSDHAPRALLIGRRE